MMDYISSKALFVSADGGTLDFTRDGEVLLSVAVPAGRVRAAEYIDLCPVGAVLEVSRGLAVLEPRSASGVQRYGDGSHDSGANPDFRPTSASRLEREMRVALNRVQAQSKVLDARMRAMSAVDRVPQAPASDPVLVEPTPAPEPTPETKVKAGE